MSPKDGEVNASLIVHKTEPENQETPIQFVEQDLVDHKWFYRRNHFPYPILPSSQYWLPVDGLVRKPALFSMQSLLKLPSKSLKMVLECSGDKRHYFHPKVYGEQWQRGAISQGIWQGVPLRTILETTGILNGAKEVVVEGFDFGKRPDSEQPFRFSRSLPLEKALHPDTIIAYAYNGLPIPFEHGYPLRLMAPQWYAMASVKWVKQITLIDKEFNGPFQSIDYVYYPHKESDEDAFPVTALHVNSTIQKPFDRDILARGKHLITGIAWTGQGMISRVEISTDGGTSWSNTELENPVRGPYEWTKWTYEWNVPEKGEYTILTRAADTFNRAQPMEAFWNRKGYGYHAVDKINIKIE